MESQNEQENLTRLKVHVVTPNLMRDRTDSKDEMSSPPTVVKENPRASDSTTYDSEPMTPYALEDQLTVERERNYQMNFTLLTLQESEKAARSELAQRQEQYNQLQNHMKELMLAESDGEGSARAHMKAVEEMYNAEKTLRVAAEASLKEKEISLKELRDEIPGLKAEAESCPRLRAQVEEAKKAQLTAEARLATCLREDKTMGYKGGGDAGGAKTVWTMLEELQTKYDAQSEELSNLRGKVSHSNDMKDIDTLMHPHRDTDQAAILRAQVIKQRDQAKEECRAWRTKYENLVGAHTVLKEMVETAGGLRDQAGISKIQQGALEFHMNEVPKMKEELTRQAAEIVQLRSSLKQAETELQELHEVKGSEGALKGKVEVMEHQAKAVEEEMALLNSQVSRLREANTVLRERSEVLSGAKADAERLSLQVKQLKLNLEKLGIEKDAITDMNNRQGQALQEATLEKQKLVSEVNQLKSAANAVKYSKPTNYYPGVYQPSVSDPYGVGSSGASGAEGDSSIVAAPPVKKEEPKQDWFARQFEWNQKRMTSLREVGQ